MIASPIKGALLYLPNEYCKYSNCKTKPHYS